YEFEGEVDAEGEEAEDVGLIDVNDDVAQAGPGGDLVEKPEPAAERQEHYPCIVVMINDIAIKATVSPFDSGRFPYN
ncbi:hypothetical protein, partial [Streptococcus pneumoniae]|uniref:hypothetical protein n=1 Tax=Streptococcus pneumoniae TaxID=1313 RepID=UPI0018B0570A